MERVNPAMRHALSSSGAGVFLLIVLFSLFFSVSTEGFLSGFNLFNLSRNIGINAIVGFAMMVVIVLGGLNLALGAIGVVTAMSFGWLVEQVGVAWPAALVLAILFGTALGALNGLLVVVTRLHSFVITLATASIYFGSMIFLTKAEAFRKIPPIFSDFSRIRIFDRWSIYIIVAMAVALILWMLYRTTSIGRQMLATGANPAAAAISGVPTGAAVIAGHALSGVIAALAAFLVLARTGAAIPSMTGVLGFDWLLPGLIGPVLGGVALAGGNVSVPGTFLGAALVTIIANGLQLTQVADYWVQSCLGLMLLGALFLDRLRASILDVAT